jgi:hypothetical protein
MCPLLRFVVSKIIGGMYLEVGDPFSTLKWPFYKKR